MIVVSH